MIVSVCSEKNLHVYFLYLSIDILVLGMQFFKCTCMFKCVWVFFYHYEVASELISFKLEVLFILLHVASYVFMDVTHIHLLNQSRPKP